MKKIVNNFFSLSFAIQVVCFAIVFTGLINLNSTITKSDLVSKNEVSKILFVTTGLFVLSIILFAFHSFYVKNNKQVLKVADSNKVQENGEATSRENELLEQKNEERKHKLKIMLEKEKASATLFETFTRFMTNELNGCQGAFFKIQNIDNKNVLSWNAGYAFYVPENKPLVYEIGEGLTGQVAKDKKLMNLKGITIDNVVVSGLGKTNPENLIICPILKNNEVFGVIEIASFTVFTKYDEDFVSEAANMLIISIN